MTTIYSTIDFPLMPPVPFYSLFPFIQFLLTNYNNDEDNTIAATKYIEEIINNFNKIQSAHFKLVKNIAYIVPTVNASGIKTVTNISIKDVPMSSGNELMAFMHSLKKQIVEMKKIEHALINEVNYCVPNSFPRAICNYYNNIKHGLAELVPYRPRPNDNPIIEALHNIFKVY